MIVFEEQLERIINVLPDLVDDADLSFKINYDWGTIETLNKFLLLPTNQSKYPLVWLATGTDENDLREPSVTRRARIIIATRSVSPDELNRYQYQNDYKVILQPILDNLLYALNNSGISRYDDTDFQTSRVPNYSVQFREDKEDKTKTGQIDIWNAITLDATITFSGVSSCLKTIFYND
jgi:hypothetical protein